MSLELLNGVTLTDKELVHYALLSENENIRRLAQLTYDVHTEMEELQHQHDNDILELEFNLGDCRDERDRLEEELAVKGTIREQQLKQEADRFKWAMYKAEEKCRLLEHRLNSWTILATENIE